MIFTIGFDTFTIEVFICVVMSFCSLRTQIKAWNASLDPLQGHETPCIKSSSTANVTKNFSERYQKQINMYVDSLALSNIQFDTVFISNLEILLLKTH